MEARMSIVSVCFPVRNRSYAYLNDRFDLCKGDIVFVEGEMEGLRGRVESISYSFKVRAKDYKRVIAKADTHIEGKVYIAPGYGIAFDPTVLSYEKVLSWYKPPQDEDEIFLAGSDGDGFALEDLRDIDARSEIIERGVDYANEGKVRCVSLDGAHGRAIVEGTEPYEVEFIYEGGIVSNLVCECYCAYTCKHDIAAMLVLRDLLRKIEKEYAEEYERTGHFTAVELNELLRFAVGGRTRGSITFND